MDDAGRTLLGAAAMLVMSLYGEDEARAIMAEVKKRIDATGLDGAFLREWLVHIKTVSVERNPWSRVVWDKYDLENIGRKHAAPN